MIINLEDCEILQGRTRSLRCGNYVIKRKRAYNEYMASLVYKEAGIYIPNHFLEMIEIRERGVTRSRNPGTIRYWINGEVCASFEELSDLYPEVINDTNFYMIMIIAFLLGNSDCKAYNLVVTELGLVPIDFEGSFDFTPIPISCIGFERLLSFLGPNAFMRLNFLEINRAYQIVMSNLSLQFVYSIDPILLERYYDIAKALRSFCLKWTTGVNYAGNI